MKGIGKLTPLAMAVLELLHERPMHPYEMAQLMRQRHVENRVNVKAGSLYHTVERLEAHGLVEVVDTERAGRRPERTVYGMTGDGRAAYVQRAKELLGTVAQEYPAYVTALALLDDLEPEDALHELRHRALRLEAAIASDEVIATELRARELPDVYWLDWRFVMDQRRFELDWTRRLIDDLEQGRIKVKQKRAAPHLNLIESTGDGNEHQTG